MEINIPAEVKYLYIKKPKIPKSLLSFVKKYKPVRAFVINLGKRETIKIVDSEIIFLPFYDIFKNPYNMFY